MKHKKNIKNIASLSLKSGQFSGLNAIDFALLSGSVGTVYVNPNEYIDIIASHGLVLDRSDILVAPMKINGGGVEGFMSIHDKILEKFSYSVHNGFKDVKLMILIENVSLYEYKKNEVEVIINKSVSYENAVKLLNDVEYERVDYVESPKQYCLKGGIIDIYSPLNSLPFRVCFYDDDFSIKRYQLSTGLSLNESIGSVVLVKHKASVSSINKKDFAITPLYKHKNKKIRSSVTKNTFTPIDFNKIDVEKNNIFYSEDLFFGVYVCGDFSVVPKHYEKNEVPSAQQEDVALQVGDLVCHEDFGIGILKGFLGLAEEDGEDFLKIKFEDAVVQLNIKSLHKLSFVSRETGAAVKLSSLNKKGLWERSKRNLAGLVHNNVKELISFYSNKNKSYRPPFGHGGAIEKDFIASFPFKETKDQDIVWGEICGDLEKSSPMYRLVCGDVGFGKTELAVRSAFRVVINKGRSLIMAPTSVLARQLYQVFMSRLEAFGIIVALYTGSCSSKDRLSSKNRWIEGKVDVLVGTSALTYDNVFIKFATLIVIDEEHRFGVKDKEGFLEGYKNKDVLMMSATPIPRSLNLSLSGLNDISTLGTPPIMRKPIQTFVSRFNGAQIKRSIEYELNRGGQVFFVHNNIQNITSIKSYLERLLPGVKIIVAHSKVGRKVLKDSIMNFVRGKADILLCTSIIGSGVDIPNANTIIVNNCHKFGLSQLHQIRGRVGRSNVQAYAYMLIPENLVLSVVAKKRLLSIEKNISLGSGYHIAKSDLNIRGGGLLFGFKQSGKSFDFGFEFYSKLMSKSIESFSGSTIQSFVDNFVYKVSFPAFFSSEYIENGFERLRAYRLLNSLYSEAKILQYRNNLVDSCGPLPAPASNLINMRFMMVLAFGLGLVSVESVESGFNFAFNSSFKRGEDLFKFLTLYSQKFGIVSYSFDQLEHVTVLKLKYNNAKKLNGESIVDFVKAFKLHK